MQKRLNLDTYELSDSSPTSRAPFKRSLCALNGLLTNLNIQTTAIVGAQQFTIQCPMTVHVESKPIRYASPRKPGLFTLDNDLFTALHNGARKYLLYERRFRSQSSQSATCTCTRLLNWYQFPGVIESK